jgi:colicin import membrane protein
MRIEHDQRFFLISIVCHVVVLFALIVSFDHSSPLAVIENTNQHDVISAVILGDIAKSKLILKQPTPPPVEAVQPKPKPQPTKTIQQAETKQKPIEKDVIALKAAAKKKVVDEQLKQAKKQRELMEKLLLADIQKTTDKQKKQTQKQLKSKFEKTLHDQAEKSLRQQLLNEEIKLQGTEVRLSQGEINKYKALIVQAISQQWVIPTQANRQLSSELMIRLAPGGMVIDVQITKSSGDPSLDSSARAAVLKASPLPVPADAAAFEPFRHFVLKVKPENLS